MSFFNTESNKSKIQQAFDSDVWMTTHKIIKGNICQNTKVTAES